jgi:hypothetical protein
MRLERSPGWKVGDGSYARPLCSHSQACDLPPRLEALPHLLMIRGGREPVAPRSKVMGNGTIGRKKTLGVPWGFEPTHAPFLLSGRLVGILGAVVEVAVLPVFDAG